MIKKVWFKKGEKWECIPCRPPYTEADIVTEGVKYEDWIKLEIHSND